MAPLAVSPLFTLALVAVAGLIMLRAGMLKRRLVWRDQRCPVCGRPRSSCICYWG